MKRMNKHLTKFAVFPLILVTLIFCIFPAYGATSASVTVNTSKTIGTNKLSLGFQTDGTWSYFLKSNVEQLVENASFVLVRFLSTVVEPCTSWNDASETGTFNWAKVDSLVKAIFSVGAKPFVTISRVKDGGGGLVTPPGMATNPATGLPYPASYAAYAVQWVNHFKSLGLPVVYYEIVNEPYAYFGWTPSTTKLGYYMQLFNAVAAAMRQANSNLSLSFDFICRQQVLDYWLANGGAALDRLDFHAYDVSCVNPYPSDATVLSDAETQFFGQWPYGYSITQAQQRYYQVRGKMLPLVNSESNFNGACSTGTDPRIQQMSGAVWLALVLRMDILDGVSYNIYYCLSASASWNEKEPTHGYGFGMINADNCQPWYPYYVQKLIGNGLAVGDQIVNVTSTSSSIRALSWIHAGKTYLLIISETTATTTLNLQGLQGTLSFSKIDNTISFTSSRVQTGTVASSASLTLNGYTVMLLHN
ncbi:MAG: hypothetical protein ABSB89_10930 [Candidatus Bathyarchaeia archaeon]